MSAVTIDIPDETAAALNVRSADLGDTLRMAAAAKLYELGKLSSGVAAALAGMSRVSFLAKLADYGVDTFDMSEEQFAKETRLA